MSFTDLQVREAFHLCFLQEFLRKFDPKLAVLKGGANLRFFFKSPRYSEDMDLDVKTASIASVQNQVLKSLQAIAYAMRTFGVRDIVPPDVQKAKQTETTQRFKVHLRTQDGRDLFTKIEFSRRGFKGRTVMERAGEELLRSYRLGSVIVQHYDDVSAFEQKIAALAGRSEVQARDVFDLYHLRTFLPSDYVPQSLKKEIEAAVLRIKEIPFEHYRDSVVSYLSAEDQKVWGRREIWRDIQNSVVESFRRGRNVP